MCFQFDVYRNPSDKTREYHPYFMIIQHDYYEDLSTRLILPLSYQNHLRRYFNAATPLVNIDFQTLFLNTTNITHVETKKLNNKNYVCNLRSARSSVLAGIDALITNT
ncbi:CcdB family protein [Enterobacter cloacae]|uniref:CcdB family protein n=1 Tax=Enterobacter TaxID=547 RepID=UPI000D1D1C21|nr:MULTISPECIES: CcdB family protein [Enterobacter]MBJ6384904.1 CcdB family protein [Enterobacter cloacae]MBJ6406334.1 CcdB family protein [Enterobacter cloacae]MBJ6435031.1 CcdB family protein [Enterobacter cloacae]MBJ6457426.1 CcdB family protein [Enterobacter cloacae]MBJ6484967.1 CcdB family protein [Enterobacter cloacae]